MSQFTLLVTFPQTRRRRLRAQFSRRLVQNGINTCRFNLPDVCVRG